MAQQTHPQSSHKNMPHPQQYAYQGITQPTSTNVVNPDLFSNYPLKGIPHPHPHDVLCGRGGQSNSHPGNAQWRMLVAANKELYVSLPKKQKMLLSQSIVNAVRSQNPPGRFLQKDSDGNSLWYDVGDKRAQEKTSQALREGAPEIRTKLHTTTIISPNPGAALTPEVGVAEPVTSGDSGTTKEPPQSTDQPQLVATPSAASVESASTQPTNNTHSQPQQSVTSAGYGLPPYQAPYSSTQLDYVPTMAPPSVIPPYVPAQGPVPERKSHNNKKKQSHPKESKIRSYENENDPAPLISSGTEHSTVAETQNDGIGKQNGTSQSIKTIDPLPYNAPRQQPPGNIAKPIDFDETDIAPPPLDPYDQFSFGSMGVMTEFEQARLMNGCSFGTTMSYAYTGNNPNQEIASRNDTTLTRPGGGDSNNNSSAAVHPRSNQPAMSQNVEDAPPPVDGGLEPVGLSFGSMMEIGENIRLETAGLSFGSMMSYTVDRGSSGVGLGAAKGIPGAVDMGLQEIGTSFGSLTLADGERERIIASARHDIMSEGNQNNQYGDGGYIVPPPMFEQTKSRGNLLECSDSESEDERQVSSEQLSAQKSLDWEKMQEVLATRTSGGVSSQLEPSLNEKGSGSVQYYSANPPRPFESSQISIPATSFDRDISQMSADDFPTNYQQQQQSSSYEYYQNNNRSYHHEQQYQPTSYEPLPYPYRRQHRSQQPQQIHVPPSGASAVSYQTDNTYSRDNRPQGSNLQQPYQHPYIIPNAKGGRYRSGHGQDIKEMPPPPAPRPPGHNNNIREHSADAEHVEYSYLNRGNSLADEYF